MHQGTREKLQAVGISCADKRAVRLRPDDYRAWDLLLGMDSYNLSNMRRIFGGDPERRMYRLLDYSAHPRDIADPWYTGDFDATYADVCEGCGEMCIRDRVYYLQKWQGSRRISHHLSLIRLLRLQSRRR